MIWIAGWYFIASVVTFTIYGLDKHKARMDRWRIKERTLHTLDLIGGWPGGFAGQRYFHHKWKKGKFMLVFWATVTLHVAGWAAVIYHLRCQ